MTITPRGQTLGVTYYGPMKDKYSSTAEEYKARIDSAMGGRAAEEVMLGKEKVTTGCGQDMIYATGLAEYLVKQMSEGESSTFRHFNSDLHDVSDETKASVDREVCMDGMIEVSRRK